MLVFILWVLSSVFRDMSHLVSVNMDISKQLNVIM